METPSLPLSSPCPCCQNRMVVAALRCETCGTKVEGPIRTHEFMSLSEEDLQFLRLFIQFEGRIRDMEAPLGLSYPTIRNRIAEFKDRLFGPAKSIETILKKSTEIGTKKSVEEKDPLDVLSDLDRGKISFDEALSAINKKKRKKP